MSCIDIVGVQFLELYIIQITLILVLFDIRVKMLVSKGAACSAINCSNNRGKNPDLSFFTFPKDEERCKQWIKNMRRADFTIRNAKYCKLCSLHFEDNQFVNSNKKRLLWSAVPTLFDLPNAPEVNGRRRPRKQLLNERSLSPRPKRRKRLARESPVGEKSYSDYYAEESDEADMDLSRDAVEQEPDSENPEEGHSDVFDDEGLCTPIVRIKEEPSADSPDNTVSFELDDGQSELYQPAFVGVGESSIVVKEEMSFEDNELESSSYHDLKQGCYTNEVDPFTSNFSCANDMVDPLQPQEVPPGLNGMQLVSAPIEEMIVPDRNWDDILDDMPLLRRRGSCSGEDNRTEKQPPAPDGITVTSDAASPKKGSEASVLSQRISWLQQQKAKVEEHIRQVRHQKQLKDRWVDIEHLLQKAKVEQHILEVREQEKLKARLEENHSIQCKCKTCKNGMTGNWYNRKTKLGHPRWKPIEPLILSPSRLCSHCNRVCATEAAYNKHLKSCTAKSSKTKSSIVDVPFLCSLCGEVFENSVTQVKHITICSQTSISPSSSVSASKHKGDNFVCGLCGENFVSEAARIKHILNCFQNKPYLCSACGKRFHDPAMRATHVRRIHEDENTCCECGLKCVSEHELDVHQQLHCGRGIVTYPCKYCDKRYFDERSRANHHMVHIEDNLFSCTLCGKRFSSRSQLNAHLFYHSEVKQYNTTSSSRKKSSSSKKQSYICALCGEKFLNEATRTKHILNCFENKPYLCSACGMRFNDPTMRACHVKRLHGAVCESMCNQCGLKCTDEHDLETHQQLYCGKDTVSFPCDMCEKHFPDTVSRAKHSIVHAGDKSFTCTPCGKNYSSRSDLDSHLLTHFEQDMDIIPISDDETDLKSSSSTVSVVENTTEGNISNLYYCKPCKISFININMLEKHKEEFHNIDINNTSLSYYCPVCDERFDDDESKCMHINSVHVRKLHKDSRYACRMCNMVCTSYTEVIDHGKVHVKESVSETCQSKENSGADVAVEFEGPEHVELSNSKNIVDESVVQDKLSDCEIIFVDGEENVAAPSQMEGTVNKDGKQKEKTVSQSKNIVHKPLVQDEMSESEIIVFEDQDDVALSQRRVKTTKAVKRKEPVMLQSETKVLDNEECQELSESQMKVVDKERHSASSEIKNYLNEPAVWERSILLQTRKHIVEDEISSELPETKKSVLIAVSTASEESDVATNEPNPQNDEEPPRRKSQIVLVNEKPPEPLTKSTPIYEINRNPPYSCYVCGEKFIELTARAEHVLMHVGEERFSCLTCGKKFTVKANLERHMTTHFSESGDNEDGPPYVCRVCGKCFITINARVEHMKMHHVVDCTTCGKFFTTKGNLKRHVEEKHMNEK